MRPSAIPPHYVETSPGVWSHPSRLGAVPATKPEQDSGKPQGNAGRKTRGKGSVGKRGRIILIACRNRELENDHNLSYSFKFIQDAIADSLLPGLPAGRADSYFRWEYGQVETRGQQGTIVKIEV